MTFELSLCSQRVANIDQLHFDEEASFLKYLDLKGLLNFASTASKALDVTIHYLQRVKPSEVQDFINNLMERLNQEQFSKQIENLTKIKKILESKKVLELSAIKFLVVRPHILKSNILEIKKSIMAELTLLDEPTLKTLEQIIPPSFFENFFEILKLYKAKTTYEQQPIFQELVEKGKLNTALEGLDLFSDNYVRDRALQVIFETLKKGDQWKKALEIALRISDEMVKNSVLVSFSETLKKEGRWDEALEVVQFISNEWRKDKTLANLSEDLREEGYWDKALEAAQLISNEWTRNNSFVSLSKELCEVGEWGRAFETINFISWDFDKISGLISISNALNYVGESDSAVYALDQAFEVSKYILNKSVRVTSLIHLSYTFGKVGEKDKAISMLNCALEVAESISNKKDKVAAFIEVSQALSEVDKKTAAAEIANQAFEEVQFLDEQVRVFLLSGIAQSFISAGEKNMAVEAASNALEILKSTLDLFPNNDSLIAISKVFSRANEPAKALEVAQLISNSVIRNDALKYLC
ncbi:MAG: hypothetical protein COT84_06895 [Chlamydiae bacterium CG10_big_fil_rev_8_21_14_0_10_35_9]|nr:MAG: hypothetical protein COT84_06895 [Chlamydiae bacterium CG10_big_fil_rev_8_21_14_0_10_35_9]